MRKIIATLFMSLDGVMEAPEQWAFAYSNDEMNAVNQAGMAASDAMLLGRVTYLDFAAFWPHQGSDVPYADYINNVCKFVVSTTLETVEWQNSMLISGDVVEELTNLKQQPGKDFTVVGSATLVQSLLRAGLLDELRIMVPPVVLGSGRHLFADDGDQQALKLVGAKTFSTGVVYLTYQPADT